MIAASLLRISLLMLALLCGYSPLVAAQTGGVYRITGTVVNSVDGSAVPYCHLSVRPSTRQRRLYRSMNTPEDGFYADGHGHFDIPVSSAGSWDLNASARGYVTQSYQAHQQYSSAIVLTPEVPTVNLRFQLPPESVVSGRVIDEAGEPVRNAHLFLLPIPRGPDLRHLATVTQAGVQSDDRGMYEFANIAPGDYRIMLQAQPWYVPSTQPRRSGPADSTQLDPSLDVTYPILWFPGVDDPAMAEIITLHGGDTRQADFHLVPIPSLHLRIAAPQATSGANGRPSPAFPIVERVTTGASGNSLLPVTVNLIQQGQIDVGGLSPGMYQVRLPGPGAGSKTAFVEVTTGSTRVVDFGTAPSVANVAVQFDGLTGEDESAIQVNMTDADTGQQFSMPNHMGAGNLRHRRQASEPERAFQVPPGRYEVSLSGKQNIYLAGITAQPAEVTGRVVKVQSGEVTMILHVASGTAMVNGVAMFMNKPSAGAMVLLVPASFGDPTGIPVLRQDQTNTDGSFEFEGVIPGQYILVAIENGWHINWRDPSTLRSYLLHGFPVEISASANVKQNIEAQAP